MPRSIRVSAALLAALVLTFTLTLGTAPAAHAAGTDRGPVGLGDWLALLWHHLAGGWSRWPGSSGATPTALFAPAGSQMDPNGTPETPPPEGSSMDPNGTPGPVSLAAPAGGDMDPNGTPGAPEGSHMDPNGGVSPTAGGDMDPDG